MRRIHITPESSFFHIFQKVIKQVTPNQSSVTIRVINKVKSAACKTEVKDTFQFNFDWIDENTCGIEVFEVTENGESAQQNLSAVQTKSAET
jgi:hypothetical protein